jgi:hypothetical protein
VALAALWAVINRHEDLIVTPHGVAPEYILVNTGLYTKDIGVKVAAAAT